MFSRNQKIAPEVRPRLPWGFLGGVEGGLRGTRGVPGALLGRSGERWGGPWGSLGAPWVPLGGPREPWGSSHGLPRDPKCPLGDSQESPRTPKGSLSSPGHSPELPSHPQGPSLSLQMRSGPQSTQAALPGRQTKALQTVSAQPGMSSPLDQPKQFVPGLTECSICYAN